MSVTDEKKLMANALKEVAAKMVIAARTAPKARGIDTFEIKIAEGDTISALAEKMKEAAAEYDIPFFERDAGNILESPVVVLIGTRIKSIGLKKCGMCGFSGCDEKNEHPDVPCVFNTGDLGLAVGSAVSVCTDHRADNRIMYTIGQAAMELGLFDTEIRIAYGIPLSATSKNPFFDRK